jgi:lysophospholipase L1-like esterase
VIQTVEPVTKASPTFVVKSTSTSAALAEATRPLASATLVEETTIPPPTLTAVRTATPTGDPVFIAADDPRIRYTGRFDFSDAKRPIFDWSGTVIEIAFSGSSLTILLEDGQNLYNVTVDGQTDVLKTSGEQTAYLVSQDLPEGSHITRITKRTEAYVGAGIFAGLILDPGHDLQVLPASTERHIEFVGDSITTGYGNEGDSAHCWFTPDTQNVELTYAAQAASHFNAAYNVVALSGLGVLRNLRDVESSSPVTAINFLHRAVAMNPTLTWESPGWAPDAVVVNLGTNDFSSLPFPDEEVFIAAYVNLLELIRLRNPETHIFAMSGPLMLGPAQNAIRTAVEQRQSAGSDERVKYVLIENTLNEAEGDFGCDRHPSVQGHRKISEQLVPLMAVELGW